MHNLNGKTWTPTDSMWICLVRWWREHDNCVLFLENEVIEATERQRWDDQMDELNDVGVKSDIFKKKKKVSFQDVMETMIVRVRDQDSDESQSPSRYPSPRRKPRKELIAFGYFWRGAKVPTRLGNRFPQIFRSSTPSARPPYAGEDAASQLMGHGVLH